jgi:hypothetical protein
MKENFEDTSMDLLGFGLEEELVKKFDIELKQ